MNVSHLVSLELTYRLFARHSIFPSLCKISTCRANIGILKQLFGCLHYIANKKTCCNSLGFPVGDTGGAFLLRDL